MSNISLFQHLLISFSKVVLPERQCSKIQIGIHVLEESFQVIFEFFAFVATVARQT